MDIIICYFFIYTVEAFILWQYTAAIFTSRYNRLWEGLALFFGYSVLYGLSFLNHFLINMSAFLIINFLFFFFMFYVKWYSALFHAAISTIIMGIVWWPFLHRTSLQRRPFSAIFPFLLFSAKPYTFLCSMVYLTYFEVRRPSITVRIRQLFFLY